MNSRTNHLLALLAALVYISPTYLWPEAYDIVAWVALQFSCLLFLILLFRITNNKEIGLRSLWALGILYTTGEVFTDWWVPEKYILLLGPIEFIIFSLGFSWAAYRPTMKLQGDKRNEQNVILVFYRPRNYFELLKAIIGLPFISLSVYADGKWLRFVRTEPCLKLLDIRPTTERYLLIDTGVKINRTIRCMMKDAQGSPARHWSSLYLRCRCVLSLVPILRSLGPQWEPKGLDFIPGVYAYRRLVDG